MISDNMGIDLTKVKCPLCNGNCRFSAFTYRGHICQKCMIVLYWYDDVWFEWFTGMEVCRDV